MDEFIGIMTIIGGCFQALTISAWSSPGLPIWMGVGSHQGRSKAGEYADKGDFASLERPDRTDQDLLHRLRSVDNRRFRIVDNCHCRMVLFLLGSVCSRCQSLLDYFRHYR